ncbi:helix-turn-helix domain-containing protein [Streptomyces griseoluteus]
MLLASAGGNRVPVIAQLVQADEDTVRDVIRRFNEIGLACLDPRWAGGRPRLLSPDDEDFVARPRARRQARPHRARAGALPGPSLRLRRVQSPGHQADHSFLLGEAGQARQSAGDLPAQRTA